MKHYILVIILLIVNILTFAKKQKDDFSLSIFMYEYSGCLGPTYRYIDLKLIGNSDSSYMRCKLDNQIKEAKLSPIKAKELYKAFQEFNFEELDNCKKYNEEVTTALGPGEIYITLKSGKKIKEKRIKYHVAPFSCISGKLHDFYYWLRNTGYNEAIQISFAKHMLLVNENSNFITPPDEIKMRYYNQKGDAISSISSISDTTQLNLMIDSLKNKDLAYSILLAIQNNMRSSNVIGELHGLFDEIDSNDPITFRYLMSIVRQDSCKQKVGALIDAFNTFEYKDAKLMAAIELANYKNPLCTDFLLKSINSSEIRIDQIILALMKLEDDYITRQLIYKYQESLKSDSARTNSYLLANYIYGISNILNCRENKYDNIFRIERDLENEIKKLNEPIDKYLNKETHPNNGL